MKNYIVMTECLNCQENKIWHIAADAENLQDAENQAVRHIDGIIFSEGYNLCCPSSPLYIIGIKESNEPQEDF